MPAPVPLAEALAAGPVVLDGGLATELEARGHDLRSRLWSARLLRDDPQACERVSGWLRQRERGLDRGGYSL